MYTPHGVAEPMHTSSCTCSHIPCALPAPAGNALIAWSGVRATPSATCSSVESEPVCASGGVPQSMTTCACHAQAARRQHCTALDYPSNYLPTCCLFGSSWVHVHRATAPVWFAPAAPHPCAQAVHLTCTHSCHAQPVSRAAVRQHNRHPLRCRRQAHAARQHNSTPPWGKHT